MSGRAGPRAAWLTDAGANKLPDVVVFRIGVVELVHQQKDRCPGACIRGRPDSSSSVTPVRPSTTNRMTAALGGGERLVANGRGKDVVALERLGYRP